MRTATHIFRWAALYGLLVIVPGFFLEARYGQDYPPPITHPEFYYGMTCVTLAWQIAFFLIASDPGRYRPLMLVAVLEKLSYGIAVLVLAGQGRVPAVVVAFGVVDLLLGAAFVYAYGRTAPRAAEPAGGAAA